MSEKQPTFELIKSLTKAEKRMVKLHAGKTVGGKESIYIDLFNFLEKQKKYDSAYMRMALEWGKLSHCERKQVGALIVKDRMIISDGFNGCPSGFENNCEDDEGNTKWYVARAPTRYSYYSQGQYKYWRQYAMYSWGKSYERLLST